MVYVPVPPGPGVVKTSNIDLCSVPCRHPPHHLTSANLRLRPRFSGMCPSGVPLCYIHACARVFSQCEPSDESLSDYRTHVPFPTAPIAAGGGDLCARACKSGPCKSNSIPSTTASNANNAFRLSLLVKPLCGGTTWRNIGHTFANPI